MTESISQVHASLTPGASTTRRVRGQTWKFTRPQNLSAAGNPAVTARVAEPKICLICDGQGYLLFAEGRVSGPCPSCRCAYCHEPTDTPPECRDCATGEKQ